MFKKLAYIFLTFLLSGCGASLPPRPNIDGPIQTLGGGFLVKSGKLKYGLTYQSKSLIDPVYAVAEFESPINPNSPLRSDMGKLDLNKEIIVQSPAFGEIKNNENYNVTLYLYSDESKTKLIHKHTDQIQFSMPISMIRKIGIKEL
ncbi:hypothetical protein [Pseudoteredinibacter isoporae]|uniref:Lipoprotein n=1 Tax=Pseudoteredinibacter isoporae TaxID=570281 RepID=A0A7X0JVY4_9GAMM|nr:hypothetical protein [Pseudoteredinibacter isoporae]MBB6522276.1 hypothetical protein [Pseudoteredinibacter isoporae]NHO87809.1 hypothetical protein [Pseudoteredinibacter isoporae]NIB23860.1 hypothetical protein [Pseudoteredinibacter isoporae]